MKAHQLIEHEGEPAYVLVPYKEYMRVFHGGSPLPFEVLLHIKNGGSPVKAWRKYRGLSVKDLALKSGVDLSDCALFEDPISPIIPGERQDQMLSLALDIQPGVLKDMYK